MTLIVAQVQLCMLFRNRYVYSRRMHRAQCGRADYRTEADGSLAMVHLAASVPLPDVFSDNFLDDDDLALAPTPVVQPSRRAQALTAAEEDEDDELLAAEEAGFGISPSPNTSRSNSISQPSVPWIVPQRLLASLLHRDPPCPLQLLRL